MNKERLCRKEMMRDADELQIVSRVVDREVEGVPTGREHGVWSRFL